MAFCNFLYTYSILKKNTCLLSHQTAFWENQDGLSSTTSGSGDDGMGSLQFKNITTKVLQQSYLPLPHRPHGMASTLVRTLEGAFYGSFHDGVKTQDMKALMLDARVSVEKETPCSFFIFHLEQLSFFPL